LKPTQQIVGVYGKLDEDGNVAWFNFILAKQNWKAMGSNALSL